MYRILTILIIINICCSCIKESSFDVNYKVIAHRGCWNESNSPENSLEGLLHAVRFGIDGVELDVCKTIDDSLVVAHGDKHSGYIIAKTDFETLRKNRLFNGECLPTLTEYLSYYKHLGSKLELIIEIKHNGEEEKILKLLKEFDVEANVKLISFGWDICKIVHSLNPLIHISYINGDRTPQEIFDAGLNGIAYNIHIYRNNPLWLHDADSLGLTTYVWGVNSESDFIWSALNELDYIVTDHPLDAMHLKSNHE